MTWNNQASFVNTMFRRIIWSYRFVQNMVSRVIAYCKVIRALGQRSRNE